jgi:hypothetical protein
MKRLTMLATCMFLLAPAEARAQDAGALDMPSISGCVEKVPEGAARPLLTEKFPDRGLSGYAATLEITIEHGKGESVMPSGLELQTAGDTARLLKSGSWVIPEQEGGAGARITLLPDDAKKAGRALTRLDLPLLALPAEPGRHVLVLPPLPVAVARANKEIMTVCTKPHAILIDDPIASTPDAQPKPNPPPRKQREEWTALKEGLAIGALGLVLGGLVAWLVIRWRRRPKPVPPPPPPRPPWEVALEKLDEIKHAGLLETQRYSEYFDRVNDTVRVYLGARYGFDGLESTSDEILQAMEHAPHFGLDMKEIRTFLEECDLVKFADLTPTLEECSKALAEAERIVRTTMPKGPGPIAEPVREEAAQA